MSDNCGYHDRNVHADRTVLTSGDRSRRRGVHSVRARVPLYHASLGGHPRVGRRGAGRGGHTGASLLRPPPPSFACVSSLDCSSLPSPSIGSMTSPLLLSYSSSSSLLLFLSFSLTLPLSSSSSPSLLLFQGGYHLRAWGERKQRGERGQRGQSGCGGVGVRVVIRGEDGPGVGTEGWGASGIGGGGRAGVTRGEQRSLSHRP